jgi:hypothetical protein
MLHQTLNGFFLHDLGDDRNPFCPLTAKEMVGGELAMARWLGWPLVTMCVASNGALALVPSATAAMNLKVPSLGDGFPQ